MIKPSSPCNALNPIKVSDENDLTLTRYIRLVRVDITWLKFNSSAFVITVELLNKDFQVLESVKYTDLDLAKYGLEDTLLKYLSTSEKKVISHALTMLKL